MSDQSDPSKRAFKVIRGSELEDLLKKMGAQKLVSTKRLYTTLDAVARKGCHAAVARPINP